MSTRQLSILAVLVVLVLVASQTLYVVTERERAVLLRFGEVVDDVAPGLHFKIPLVNTVRVFDGRVLTLDSTPERYLTVGKKFVEVDSFVKWRIKDVKAFYQATAGDRYQASTILSNLTNDGLRAEFGERTLTEVVSGERDELMESITQRINNQIQDQYGIEVLDVRVKAIDMPEDLSANVYSRMSAERAREAQENRSQGKELAEGIEADADRQKVVIEAQAQKESEQIRGEGDAMAAEIYAKAYNADPEFYAFYRSLNAYKSVFSQKDDLLVIEPDSDFFKYLNQQQ